MGWRGNTIMCGFSLCFITAFSGVLAATIKMYFQSVVAGGLCTVICIIVGALLIAWFVLVCRTYIKYGWCEDKGV